MILLNGFFTSVYGHIAFLQITDYNVGLNGMQFINPSAYQLWVKRIGSYLDHFTVPIYSIPKRLKLDMSIKLMLEVMKVKFNFYVALFVVSFLLICLSLYILFWYRLYIINSSFVGIFLLSKVTEKKVKNVEGTPVRTATLSEISNGEKSKIPNGQVIEENENKHKILIRFKNSFEKRKIEVGEELAKKWMYTVVNFEHGFSIYLYRKGFNLIALDYCKWPKSRFITKAPR